MEKFKDVHTEHCCIDHGCKYGEDDTCTVVTGQAKQSYGCEYCPGGDVYRDYDEEGKFVPSANFEQEDVKFFMEIPEIPGYYPGEK